ncbi:protein MIZU-KUSSEI 1 [Ananas comosus]|uniref:Protein MIZU-KUSSEI 1 n=1 Tax=Ananas comosus TaxID=4615 RepID=A0A6P5GYU4_ANACO|nr:protein MIZU-KUSSEI 1 [Ananas comosus]
MGNPIHPIPSPSPRPPPPTTASAATSRTSGATAASSDDGAPQQPMLKRTPISLVQPPRRRRPIRLSRPLRVFRSLCRTLPIFSPKCGHLPAPCKLPSPALYPSSSSDFHLSTSHRHHHHHNHHRSSSSFSPSTRVTGTLFGHRRGRVSLSLQQNPRCLPSLVVELAMQTQVLLREMGSGMVRVALECEKRPGGGGCGNGNGNGKDRQKRLLEEPLWTMFCNGKKSGYGVRREATEEDLAVMETLKPVSMGAGVMPAPARPEGADGAMAYVRAFFEHVVGSRDSETLYMISPDGGNGPELTIFFIRI